MVGLIVFLVGLVLPKVWLQLDVSFLIIAVLLFVAAIIARRRDRRIFYVAFVLLCLAVGWWRGSVYVQKLAMYDALFYETVAIEAKVLEDAVYNDKGQLLFTVDSIAVQEPVSQELIGQMEIAGFGANAVYRGDHITASGFMFPKRGANQAGMSFANITIVERGTSPIDKLRREFAAGMQNALPEQLASFALGLLIGQRTTMSPALNDELITVGLIHIVAVSGYNLTVIINANRKLFVKRSRYQTLVFSLLLIGLFLLLTGNSPSIVRAALVSVLSLLAWYFGRKFRPVLLLLLSGVITAGINPLYLWSNIGWHLSFTAFFGVLVLAPLLQKRFFPTQLQGKLLPSVLAETTAAQLCTLPIILFVFGRLSNISIIANLLVVPAVPFAMFFSLFAGISGMVGSALTGIIALPAKIVLEYILSMSSLMAKVPHANVPFKISAAQLAYLYVLVIALTLLLQRKVGKSRDTITRETKE